MNTCLRRWIFLLILLFPISGAAVESRPPIVPQGERIENVTEAMSDLVRLNGADDLAFGPEGKVLAAVDGSERVRLWRVPGGREMVRLTVPGENLFTVAISPDGAMLAAGASSGVIRIWRLQDGKEIWNFQQKGRCVSLHFGPDAKKLATAGNNAAYIRRVDHAADPLVLPHRRSVSSVRFGPEGKTVITSARDRAVRIWNAETGVLERESGPLCIYEQMTYDISGLGKKARRRQKDYCDCALRFSPTGARVAGKWRECSAYLWDVESGLVVGRFEDLSVKIGELALHPDGKTIAADADSHAIILWDTAADRSTGIAPVDGQVAALRFSPDGKVLAFSAGDSGIYLWDMENQRELKPIASHSVLFRALDISPDGRYLASTSRDEVLRIWDLNAYRELRRLEGAGGRTVRFSPDGKSVASAFRDGRLVVHDVATGRALGAFETETDGVFQFSPDGKGVALPGERNHTTSASSIVLMDVESGEKTGRYRGHPGKIDALDFSPDGRFLLSSASDKTIRLWDVATGAELRRMSDDRGLPRLTFCNLFSDNLLRFWDVASGDLAAVFAAGENGVWVAVDLRRNKTYRYDDGTFLQRATAGRRTPIPARMPQAGVVQREEDG